MLLRKWFQNVSEVARFSFWGYAFSTRAVSGQTRHRIEPWLGHPDCMILFAIRLSRKGDETSRDLFDSSTDDLFKPRYILSLV